MRLDPRIHVRGNLPGWVVVDAWLGRGSGLRCSNLVVRRTRNLAETEKIVLPVLPNGRIHELIKLPEDVDRLDWHLSESGRFDQAQLILRSVGWFERTWRMTNRVLRNWFRLSRAERSEIGLSIWRVLVDLPSAYRIATEFGIRRFWPADDPDAYADWIKRFDLLSDSDCQLIRAHITDFSDSARFHLLVVIGREEQQAFHATLSSLRAQLYRNFTCSVLDSTGIFDAIGTDIEPSDLGFEFRVVTRFEAADWLTEFNRSIGNPKTATWIMLLRAGDTISPHALYWFASEILKRPDAAILYSDDDTRSADGERYNPRFKPDWSLAYLRAAHYLGHAAILRGSAVAAAGGVNLDCCRHGNYDLLLRVIDCVGGNVIHVPAVLFHGQAVGNAISTRQQSAGASEQLPDWGGSSWCMDVLRAHLSRSKVAADVLETRPGCWRVRYRLPPEPPLVSIIIPTRDSLHMIRQCVHTLLERTTYPNFELLIVDNQSTDLQTLAFLAGISQAPGVRILPYDRPFNYSAINNFAVREARGKVLCLLNNDTEVISRDWLEEMVGHLLQPHVGVTGAKLYFPDGRVQHAGDAVGPGGCANHLHSFIGWDDPGYCERAVVAQELSAVTAACLVTWRSLYLQLGGLDEKRLKVAFNDVDYCLRVRRSGYRVIWTPHAELYHHESVSRGDDGSWRKKFRARREVVTMRRRWKQVMQNDPFYNPNLSYEQPDFSLSRMPRVRKPWMVK